MTLRMLFEKFHTCGQIGLSRDTMFDAFGPELTFLDEGDVSEFDIIFNAGLLNAKVIGLNSTLHNGEPMLEIGLYWNPRKRWPAEAVEKWQARNA